MELLCSLVVLQQILLYVLSDGSRVNRLWLGGCCLLYRQMGHGLMYKLLFLLRLLTDFDHLTHVNLRCQTNCRGCWKYRDKLFPVIFLFNGE